MTFSPTQTAGTWNVAYAVDNGTPVTSQTQIAFNAAGVATTPSFQVTGLTLSSTTNATLNQPITISTAGLTQNSGASNASTASQDGLAPGTLTGFSFGANGTITGTYSNGLTGTVGQLVTATFSNPQGLQSLGNNLYTASPNSGTAVYGTPGSGGNGSLVSGELEGSNVNLTNELSNMIIAQRGYQANSQVVTTEDQMLQELMSVSSNG
jgi:flagellar hook protein FlgE